MKCKFSTIIWWKIFLVFVFIVFFELVYGVFFVFFCSCWLLCLLHGALLFFFFFGLFCLRFSYHHLLKNWSLKWECGWSWLDEHCSFASSTVCIDCGFALFSFYRCHCVPLFVHAERINYWLTGHVVPSLDKMLYDDQARSQKFVMGGCSGSHGQIRTKKGLHLKLKQFVCPISVDDQKKGYSHKIVKVFVSKFSGRLRRENKKIVT